MYLKIFLYNILFFSSLIVSAQIFNESYSSLSKKADSLRFIEPKKGLEHAIKAHQLLNKNSKDYTKSLLLLARLQKECGLFNDAIKNYKKGLTMPLAHNERLYFLSGLFGVKFLLGDEANSVSQYSKALNLAFDSLGNIDKAELMRPLASSFSYLKLWDSSLVVFEKLEPIAQKVGGKSLGDYHSARAYDFYLQNHFDTARYHYLKAIEILDAHHLPVRKADVHRALSVLESTRNQYSVALKQITEAEKIYEKYNIDGKLANIYKNRAYIYKMTYRNNQAIKFYKKAIQIFEAKNMVFNKGITLLNLAELYSVNLNQYDKAIKNLDKSIIIFHLVKNKKYYSIAKFHKAYTLFQTQAYKEALNSWQESHNLFVALKDTVSLFKSLTLSAHINNALNKTQNAKSALQKAKKLYPKIQGSELKIDFYQAYLTNNLKLGNKKNITLALKKLKQIQSFLDLTNQKNKVIDLQVSYEVAKREEQLAIEKANLEAMELVVKEQSNVNRLTLLTASVLLFILFIVSFFVISLRRKTKQVAILNNKLNKQNKLLTLSADDLKDRHVEVNHLNEKLNYTNSNLKIKKDHVEQLHHEMNHRIKNNLQSLSTTFSLQMEEMEGMGKSVFIEAQNRVDAMGLLHKSLYQNAKSPSYINLLFFVEQLLTNIEKAYDLNVEIKKEIEISIPKIDVHLGIEVCLMLNEIVNNSIKYAFPDHQNPTLQVKIYEEGSYVHIEVYDNGPGLPNDFSIENAESLGMKLIHSFVRKHEGKCTIKNDNGVRYEITLPYEKSAILS